MKSSKNRRRRHVLITIETNFKQHLVSCLVIKISRFLILMGASQVVLSGKEPTGQCSRYKRWGFDPWVGKIPWRNAWQPTPVFFHGESHGQRSLVSYSSWGCKGSDTTEATEQTHIYLPVYLSVLFICIYSSCVISCEETELKTDCEDCVK